MYYCQDCEKKFNYLKREEEKHGLSSPPYEVFYVCPYCGGSRIQKIEPRYCKCCGARMYGSGDYCSASCKKRGEYMWKMQRRRQQLLKESPLFAAVREVDEFNRNNGTHLSYGQYFALVSNKKD